MVGIEAPSIRLKAFRLPPSSRIATFSVTPSSLAFATAAFTIFCASSEEMLCFSTTLAIRPSPFLSRADAGHGSPIWLNRGSTAIDRDDCSGHVAGAWRGEKCDDFRDLRGVGRAL